MRRAPAQGGFTLIELMIIVAIMGILSATVRSSHKFMRLSDAMRAPADQMAQQGRLAEWLRPDARAARSVSVSRDGSTLVFNSRGGRTLTYSFSQGRLLRQGGQGSAKDQTAFLASFHCSLQAGAQGAQLLQARYSLPSEPKKFFPLFEVVQP